MKVKIDWKWLAGTAAVALIGLLIFFLQRYMNKIDKIDDKFQIIVNATEDTKKIKEVDLPAIKKDLSDQKTILVTLAVGTKGQLSPEFKDLIDRFIKAAVKQELTATSEAIFKVRNLQEGLSRGLAELTTAVKNTQMAVSRDELKTDFARLGDQLKRVSDLVEKQQRLFAAASLINSRAYLDAFAKILQKPPEKGDTVGGTPAVEIRVSNPDVFSRTIKELSTTLGSAGVEAVKTPK